MTFDEFWEIYPRRTAKKAARKAWDKIKMNDVIAADIVQNIRDRLSSGDWSLSEKQYIPHPATYLNGERWEDEIVNQTATSLFDSLTDTSWAQGLVDETNRLN